VHSAAGFQDILQAHPDQLVVLMCKAMSCRPCKVRLYLLREPPLLCECTTRIRHAGQLVRACTCNAALCYLPIYIELGGVLSGDGVQMFTRKFERLAASYSDAVFCEILGDENNDTRVRRTPVCCCISGLLVWQQGSKARAVQAGARPAQSQSPHHLCFGTRVAGLALPSLQPVWDPCEADAAAGGAQRMMMELQVKVTPTFMLFRGRTEAGEPARVHSLTGINEANLRRAVLDHLEPGEAGAESSEQDAGPAPEGAPPTGV
jgi:hypothetical protein